MNTDGKPRTWVVDLDGTRMKREAEANSFGVAACELTGMVILNGIFISLDDLWVLIRDALDNPKPGNAADDGEAGIA